MTADQIRSLPGPGEGIKFTRREGRRLAKEHGVPLVEAGEQSRKMFYQYGLAYSIESRCSVFGIAPVGYYDEKGRLKAIRVPRLLSAAQKREVLRRRQEMINEREH